MSITYAPESSLAAILKEIASIQRDGEQNNGEEPLVIRINLSKRTNYTPEHARNEARDRSSKIFTDQHFLRRVLERYEGVIQKRWLKKSREQRKQILLTAWPNMALSHRPDFDAFMREKSRGRTKFRDAFLWPYITLGDLLKPKLLLIFLNARGRNSPAAFSSADLDSIHFGIASGKLKKIYFDDHIMMLTGRNSPETYAELVPCKDNVSSSNIRGGMPACDGFLVLEVQERIYAFLVKCCLLILHDHTRESLMQRDVPIQPKPPRLSLSEAGGISTLATLAVEAVYRLPANLDLVRLRSIVAAKLSAAEDHIWALREDPNYFSSAILEGREHRIELVPDVQGTSHPDLRPHRQHVIWDRVLGNAVAGAYFSLIVWDELDDQIGNLQSLMEKYAKDIAPEKDLPNELFEAFLKFRYYLKSYTRGPIANLEAGVPASPPLRPFFVRSQASTHCRNLAVMNRPGLLSDKSRDRLLWIFRTMFNEEEVRLPGLHTLIDELERMAQNDEKIKGLLSAWITTILADIAVLSQSLRQTSLFQPWSAVFDDEMEKRIDDLKAEFDGKVSRWAAFFRSLERRTLADLGSPADGKFFYPIEKRRTLQTTEALRTAEWNLDKFWERVDRHFIRVAGNSQHPTIRKLLTNRRILRRTPEWVEPADAAKTNVLTEDTNDGICMPLSQLYLDLEQRTQSTLGLEEVLPLRPKVKTRGAASAVQKTNGNEDSLDEEDSDSQSTLLVDQRAWKVFATLFYLPSSSSQPGEIAWNDFLHAMATTGFAVEKLYGSVWQFTPSNPGNGRSIQFHEPHPTGKIPFHTARRHGRRLSRAYGWYAGMFKLSDQNSQV